MLLFAVLLIALATQFRAGIGSALHTKIDAILLFWIAFILTRPWGAEVGNILSFSRDRGGLGLGDADASAPSSPSWWSFSSTRSSTSVVIL